MKPALTHQADPFLAGTLFDVMHDGGRLNVDGDVAGSLLRNIEELQGAWNKWRPKLYQKFEIVADRECEATPAKTTAAVSTFSCGVDSCFTVWRHHANLAGHQQCDLRAGLVVHGFDIPLNQQADYDRNCCKCQKCVSVMFHFRMLGMSKMECFPDDITNRQIIWMSYPSKGEIDSMKRVIGMAKDLNVTDSWVRALKLSILLNQIRMRTPRPLRSIFRTVRRSLGLT